jgi:hypothetical protein
VVSYLATYEDVSTETAVRVLSDEVLLRQLRPDEQTDAQFRELIENAVFRDNVGLLATVDEEKRSTEQANTATQLHAAMAAQAGEAAEKAGRAAEQFRLERDDLAAKAQAVERQSTARAADLERAVGRERGRAVVAERQLNEERARSRRYWCGARIALAVVLGVAGVLAIAFGPEQFNWKTATDHENRTRISVLSAAAWLGLCWLVVKPKSWQVILTGVVLASVISAVTLL